MNQKTIGEGTILWEDPYNNYQLVLRDDGLYGISGQIDEHKSRKFDPLTGEVLVEFETRRRACARPNGSIDAIFYRALGGSTRLDINSQSPQWISPMRAQCHDGVTIANGLLYWWPSVCDCQNTLYGLTCLGPAGDFDFSKKTTLAGAIPNHILLGSGLLAECKISATASKSETQGLSIIEGMIFGLPGVGVNARGIADVLSNGNGLLVTPDEPEELAEIRRARRLGGRGLSQR